MQPYDLKPLVDQLHAKRDKLDWREGVWPQSYQTALEDFAIYVERPRRDNGWETLDESLAGPQLRVQDGNGRPLMTFDSSALDGDSSGPYRGKIQEIFESAHDPSVGRAIDKLVSRLKRIA